MNDIGKISRDMPAVGRRWVVLGLKQMGLSPAAVRKATGMDARQQEHWVDTFAQTGDVQAAAGQGARTDRAEIIAATKATLKRLCDDEDKDARSSKCLAQHVAVAPRQVRRHLNDPAVSAGYRNLAHKPMLTAGQVERRLIFARARRDQAFCRVAFTDSKYFVGEVTAKNALRMFAWHPPGGRCEAYVNKHTYQVHVYGAVTYWGAVNIIEATGTTGVTSQFVYQTGPSKGAPNRGVCGEEYITIFDRMHAELDALFKAHNVDDWVFQQDGATAHTSKKTIRHIIEKMGNDPRRLILKWPANSPDLSWIENIWALVENRLWSAYRWRTLAEFRVELGKAWRDITSDLVLMRKMSNGMRERMREVIRRGGAHIGK